MILQPQYNAKNSNENLFSCAASFKNSSGIGEYMELFLAEAREKRTQELGKHYAPQGIFEFFHLAHKH
jgi:hypothetical protein